MYFDFCWQKVALKTVLEASQALRAMAFLNCPRRAVQDRKLNESFAKCGGRITSVAQRSWLYIFEPLGVMVMTNMNQHSETKTSNPVDSHWGESTAGRPTLRLLKCTPPPKQLPRLQTDDRSWNSALSSSARGGPGVIIVDSLVAIGAQSPGHPRVRSRAVVMGSTPEAKYRALPYQLASNCWLRLVVWCSRVSYSPSTIQTTN